MSLFENDRYHWRETYFVLFNEKDRPDAESVQQCMAQLGSRYEVTNVKANSEGKFEGLTLLSPYDHAAMDIVYLTGEDVAEQLTELTSELKQRELSDEEEEKRRRLPECNARLDIFHFEQIDFLPDEEEEILDPGALLLVIEQLAELCRGVGIDPQSGEFM